MTRRKSISELAALSWPDAAQSSQVAQNTDHGFNHPNRNPDGNDYVVKITHESNWYLDDVAKNINLYQMGDVLFVDYDSERADDGQNIDMLEWTATLYYMPYNKDQDEVLEQLSFMFGGSVGIEFMTKDEYDSEVG